MFSYVLVVSACYILLISTCSMLKTGTLHSIANSAILKNLLKSYFKIAKIQVFLLNCTKIQLIILC